MGVNKSLREARGAGVTMWSLSWQASVGRDFLADENLIEKTRDRLIRAHSEHGSVLLYYLLMPSEIHAISRIEDGQPVSSVTRSFSHVVSRWVRAAQGTRGSVFAGPCQINLIESEAALRDEIRMLAWRPVTRTLCRIPTHYPHASLRIALGAKPGAGFDAEPLQAEFAASKTEARDAIRRCIHTPPTGEEWRVWELTRRLELPEIRVEFRPPQLVSKPVDAVAATLIAAGGSFRIDDALELLAVWVVSMIDPSRGVDLHKASSRLAARGRALVACLAVNHGLCYAASVAQHFGRAKGTLGEQMKVCRSRPTDMQILATPLQRILEESAALRAARGRMHYSSKRR